MTSLQNHCQFSHLRIDSDSYNVEEIQALSPSFYPEYATVLELESEESRKKIAGNSKSITFDWKSPWTRIHGMLQPSNISTSDLAERL